jgi:hypothetical protein
MSCDCEKCSAYSPIVEHIAEVVVQACRDVVDRISGAPDRRVDGLLCGVTYTSAMYLRG